MEIEYYWFEDDLHLLEWNSFIKTKTAPMISSGIKLSFSEFRDLVQCRARGGLIISDLNGRPVVKLSK